MNNIDYFLELRSRILNSLFVITIIFCILCFFARDLYDLLTIPLIIHLNEPKLIATNVISPLMAPFKLAFVLAIIIAIPYILYQLWAFIAPALYRKERHLIWLLLIVSTFLFYIGIAFAYFIFLPNLFQFITHFAPSNVDVKPDINLFLDFTLKMFLIFGMAFEVPLIVLVLNLTGITNVEQLKHLRPYIIVGAFILGMLLTPPDVVSQIMLAIPLWLLFELGLFLSVCQQRWTKKNLIKQNI